MLYIKVIGNANKGDKAMTEQQTQKLFSTFINAIMEKCAEELGVSLDTLRFAYINNPDVRSDLDSIFERHINELGSAA